MSEITCPQCGAGLAGTEPDPLARCPWCGSLLSAGKQSGRPLVAKPRLDERRARSLVARSLARVGHNWLPGTSQLVYYPFAATGQPRQPYRPLTHLPPLLGQGWRPSGADLISADTTEPGPGSSQPLMVPARVAEPLSGPIVHYPFFRVPLSQAGQESAAWCDAVTGQVMLPTELALPQSAGQHRLGTWAAGAMAIGLVSALVLPFPFAAGLAAAGCALIWWAAGRG